MLAYALSLKVLIKIFIYTYIIESRKTAAVSDITPEIYGPLKTGLPFFCISGLKIFYKKCRNIKNIYIFVI